jgi:hypothetical protein
MLYLRKEKRRAKEETIKINSCIDNSISVSQTVNPTIQHPAVKNIKINPGINNSAIRNTTPTRNHISEGERFIFLPVLIVDIVIWPRGTTPLFSGRGF